MESRLAKANCKWKFYRALPDLSRVRIMAAGGQISNISTLIFDEPAIGKDFRNSRTVWKFEWQKSSIVGNFGP